MSEQPSAGDVLLSTISDARFLVLDAGTAVRLPSLGGVPLSRGKPQPCSKACCAPPDCEMHGGERYVDPVTRLTLLCIWPGRGPLCYEGRQLTSAHAMSDGRPA
jgi:hypothetical protein